MKIYDLRSDTITKPSEDMRKAMYNAKVGDDVYGEDPTVNKLQELSCKITGKKAALLVSSGSMGNLIALYINGGRGKDVIMHREAHSLHHELGAPAAIAGVNPIGVPGARGILRPETVTKFVNSTSGAYHDPKTSMIVIENTHNFSGGTCYSKDELKNIFTFAKKRGISLHLDGARVFNASIATGISVKEICSYSNTATFSLSKGLGAPMGAILVGSKEFIEEAKIIRKMLGGGTRQAGIIAAAGIYALENNIELLQKDHEHATILANALNKKNWAKIDPLSIQTNILIFDTLGTTAEKLVKKLSVNGIESFATGENSIRFVTSLEQNDEDIESICKIINEISI
ncbi:MAG: threonine aldolase [Spirochaetaceae bacterium 4572_7]|nr:MAG: threonine aldolase [Spirochaetaceae bacterium 4572_7]